MPIQFRCNYCNQLLSIATRKAGAVVSCPTCAARVIVPRHSDPAKIGQPAREITAKAEAGAAKEAAPKAGQALLEQGDFEDLLKGPEPAHDRPEPVPAPLAQRNDQPPSGSSSSDSLTGQEVNVELVATLPVTGSALVLTPARASILAVAIVVLLAAAFLAGLWVGRLG